MSSGQFLHFFPTPRFLRMPTAGLNISDDAIRFIELREDRGGFLLEKHDDKNLPEGVIQNGTIQDRDKLVSALQQLRDANNLKFVRVSLPEEKSYLYHASVPYVANDDQMRESVEYTIEENVPFSADEVVFDYDVITDGSVESSEEVGVAVSVLPVDVVEEYLDVITTSGLQPLSLMVESQAVSKAVVPRENPNAVLVINVRENTTAVYIVHNNAVYFTSSFTTKGGSVSAPAHMSFVEEKEGTSKKDDSKQQKDDFVEQNSQSIVDEVKRVLSYWRSHEVGSQEGNKITKIILCGSQATNTAFKQVLSSELRLDIETANVWVNALMFDDYVPSIPINEALHYAAAIGLALPEHI